jgi:hypothetical protein
MNDHITTEIQRIQEIISSLRDVITLPKRVLALQTEIKLGRELDRDERLAYQIALDEMEELSGIPDPNCWSWFGPSKQSQPEFGQDTLLELGLRELVTELAPLMYAIKEMARFNDETWNSSDCYGKSGDGWLASGC